MPAEPITDIVGAMPTDILTVRRATQADTQSLAWLAATTFMSTYAGAVADEELIRYVGKNFSNSRIGDELADPAIDVFVASNDALVGYGLTRRTVAPGFVPGDEPLELGRLYVTSTARGMGIGSALLDRVEQHGRGAGHDWIWLTVWERNHNAIAAYRAWGFQEFGTVRFPFGSSTHTDRVMAKRVSA